MSNLRDLVVSIDFDGIDIRRLTHMDSAINEIENNLVGMGGSITDLTSDANRLGRNGSNAMNDIRNSAGRAEVAVDNVDNTTSSAGKSFNLFGSIGAKAMAGIAAAATVAYGSIVAIVTESQTAFDRLEAKTGTTGAALEGLKNVATNVFNGASGESLTQVTDDVSSLKSMFKELDNETLQSLTEGAYTISSLWGPEVKEVGKTVKTMRQQFTDLSQTDALDLITTAFQKTGDYSDDLLDTFNEYSVYFKQLGFNAKDFTNILVKGAQAGAFNMDKVGDAVKELGIRSMDGSKTSVAAFKAIGLNANDLTKKFAAGGDSAKNAFAATVAGLANIKDPVKQSANGVALFGTQWEDLRQDVILAMTDGKDAVGQFQGATQSAANAASDNFGSKMTSVFRTLKTDIANTFNSAGGQELLDSLAQSASNLVPTLTDLVDKMIGFGNSIRENWPIIKEIGIGLGVFIGVVGTAIGIIRLITLAQYAWNIAMSLNPLGLVVIGIAALVAIGVVLYRNWDTIKEKAGQLWAKTKEVFGNFKDYMMEKLQPVIDFFGKLTDKWDSFKSSISSFKMPSIGMPKWLGGNGLIQTDGSHATGLNRVPWNGYVAELHKDEAVLTASQANEWRNNGGSTQSNADMSSNFVPTKSEGGKSSMTFAPQVKIEVSGGPNGVNANDIAEAVEKKMAEMWQKMMIAQPGI